jgi:hypothetical protein
MFGLKSVCPPGRAGDFLVNMVAMSDQESTHSRHSTICRPQWARFFKVVKCIRFLKCIQNVFSTAWRCVCVCVWMLHAASLACVRVRLNICVLMLHVNVCDWRHKPCIQDPCTQMCHCHTTSYTHVSRTHEYQSRPCAVLQYLHFSSLKSAVFSCACPGTLVRSREAYISICIHTWISTP